MLDENDKETFEEEYRELLLQEADGYVEKMPQLEWIYLGQIPMAVELCLERGRKIARPLASKRNSCRTLLQEMFGWKGLLPT